MTDPTIRPPVDGGAHRSAEVDAFNAAHAIGDRFLYRSDPGAFARPVHTRTEAAMLGGHTPTVFVRELAACVALSALEPMTLLPVVDEDEVDAHEATDSCCTFCDEPHVSCSIPVDAAGDPVPNDYTGEWAPRNSCAGCYNVHAAGGPVALEAHIAATQVLRDRLARIRKYIGPVAEGVRHLTRVSGL